MPGMFVEHGGSLDNQSYEKKRNTVEEVREATHIGFFSIFDRSLARKV